jgi:nicotinate phosphoribosyltransferase
MSSNSHPDLFPGSFRAGHLSGLLTDLYELTMTAGYVEKHLEANATFELFVRHLPHQRNYLVAAGLEQALGFLENVHFAEDDIAYLRGLALFRKLDSAFFEFLAAFRFTGDVWAMPEGTIFFPGEPLLRITAPIAAGQLVETSLLSILHVQTLVASKAARITTAAQGRAVIEFGSRRAHGIEAGVLAARAAFIGGCEGTSNSFAGARFGIPVHGTQAHSWVMAHEKESESFANFLDVFPHEATLVVDTYNVHAAIEKVIALGRKPRAVRLDSGDLLAESKWVRERLDRADWKDVHIFASGDLDEWRIQTLVQRAAPLDAFGVGTALSTSADAPWLPVIYKLVELEFEGRIRPAAKWSEQKKTYPGRKQVFRFVEPDGRFHSDTIGLEDEVLAGSQPLLLPVMRQGRRIEPPDACSVKAARERFLAARANLPAEIRALEPAARPFPVAYSPRLERLSSEIERASFALPTSRMRPGEREPRTIIFWEVDVQNDFMLPGGKLYVPGAETVIANIARLVRVCRERQVFLVSSADAHRPDDPEFRNWPPHCLKGSSGAELLPEAMTEPRLVIPNQSGFPLGQDALVGYRQVVLEKNTLDVFDNPNTDRLLAQLEEQNPGELEFVVFGVVTEYCVRLAAQGLIDRGRPVTLVTDAIQPLAEEKSREVLNALRARGARLVTTAEIVGSFPPGAPPEAEPEPNLVKQR